ncbi:hypothetical protein RB653_008857 [Dictyostelium firmibasis]|uniref:TPR-like protein n=1 Tax=Dictyostelium firmibasis TaxID=79012 RepID=A0AAN7U1A0_9MYCE
MDYIKNKLKETREAIDKKDYKTALENCNEIVQYDDKNFMIHLFLGVSNFNLNNLAAAEKSYNTAFKLQKSPIPLRGLLELFNKTNEYDKISNILKELIPLTTDEQKKKELIYRLIEISGILKDYKTLIELISPILFENEASSSDSSESSNIDRIKLLEKFEDANYQNYLNTLKSKIDEKLREKNIPIVDYSKSHNVLGSIQHTPEQKQERDKIEFEIIKSLINNFNLKVYEELLLKNNLNILTNEQMIRIYTHFIQILISKRRVYSSEENKDEDKQKQLRKEIKENCERMNEMLSTPIYSLEILINLLEEEFNCNDNDDDDDNNNNENEGNNNELYEKINEISTIITNKYSNRGLGWIGLGFYKVFKLKDYSEQSKQLIEKGFSNAGSTDSLLGYLALSKWYLKVENHERVRDIVKKSMIVYEQKQRSVGGANYFDNIFIKLQLILVESLSFNCNFELASSLLESLIKKFSFHFISLTFSLAKLNFYSIKDYKKSKELFESIVEKSIEQNDHHQNNIKILKKTIELSKIYLIWIKILTNDSKESLINYKENLKEIIESNDETVNNYLIYYIYGLILIKLIDEKDNNIEQQISIISQQFLKSAKLNPNHSDTFAKLGTLYKKIGQKERSKKCYQKSLQLDILNDEAGFELGEIYAESGQTSLVMSLYKEITDFCLSSKQIKRFPINVVKCSWAFYRLAIYQMDNKDIHNSVVSLLNAIKGEPLNESYWRTLAEAYRRQFKYVAALKSLKKAEEILDNENRIATDINFQIATLSKTLGLYDDAIVEYDRVLKQLENNVPSLKGKAECLLQLSMEQYKLRNFRQSLIQLQLAESSVRIALEKENNFHSLWRLYADISGYFLNLPPPPTELSENLDNSDYLIEKSKQSSNAYFNCVRIHSNHHSLQDLSIGYYNQYIIYKNYLKKQQEGKHEKLKIKITKEETENLLKSSIKCVVEALNLSSSDPMLWNLLGVVLMDKFPLQSQHALIRSIQLDSSKSEPYNNLTLLYFEYGFIEQSDKSLMIAKNNNVDSVISWSLQGLINEVKSSNEHNSNNENNENKDNNNNSTGREDYNYIDNALESSPIGQGLLGYGITSLLEGYSETSYSVLYKYVELNPNSIEGNNSLALVYSHQNDYENSEKYFKSALNLLSSCNSAIKSGNNNNESKITLNNNNNNYNSSTNCSIGSILFSDKPLNDGIEFSNDEKLKYIRINLSRTQYYLGKFEEALDTIKPYIITTSTEPSLSNSILFELVSLIYCKLNKLNESIEAMKKSISQIPKSLDTATIRKQNLLFTLAKIQYSCINGSDNNNNKQIDTIVKTLEAIITIDKRFYKAWYYLAAIYIDCGKNDLAKNVLIKLQNTVEQLEFNSYLLLSKIHLLDNEIEQARKQLQKLIHLFPLEQIGWTSLAELEMKYFINNNNNKGNEDPCNLPLSLLNHSLNKKQGQEYSGIGQLSVGPDHKVLQPPTIKELEIIAKANLCDLQSPWTKCLDNAIVIMKRIIHSNPLSTSKNNNIQPWIHLQNLLYWRSLYTDSKEDWESTKSCWNVVQYLMTSSTSSTTTEEFKFQQILIELEFKLALSIIGEGENNDSAEFEKLISNYQKQINHSNEKKSVILSLEAKRHLRQGDKVKALSTLKEALKLDSTSIPIYYNISDIYQSNDQLDASLLCLNRSLLILKQSKQQINNNNGLILTTLTKIIRIYCIQKKFKDALKLLDENLTNNNYLDNPVIKLLKAILIIGSSKLTNNNLKQFTNDMKNALNLLEESSTINSKLSLTNFYSAVVQFNLKNFNLSDTLLQKELNITPSLSLQINSLQEKIKQFTK